MLLPNTLGSGDCQMIGRSIDRNAGPRRKDPVGFARAEQAWIGGFDAADEKHLRRMRGVVAATRRDDVGLALATAEQDQSAPAEKASPIPFHALVDGVLCRNSIASTQG